MANNGCSSINILLLTLCYLSARYLVHKIVVHIIARRRIILYLANIWQTSSKRRFTCVYGRLPPYNESGMSCVKDDTTR